VNSLSDKADHIIASGTNGAVRWLCTTTGSVPAKKDFENLDLVTQEKLRSRCNTLVKADSLLPKEMFRNLQDNVYELKLSTPAIRLFCVKDGKDWLVTEIARKPKKKQLEAHINRAKNLYAKRQR
jgi:hypothetical protein